MTQQQQPLGAFLILAIAVLAYGQDVTTVPGVTTVTPKITVVQTVPVIADPQHSTTITQFNNAGPLVPLSGITGIPIDTGKPPGPPAPTEAPTMTDPAIGTSTTQKILTTPRPTLVPTSVEASSNTVSSTLGTSGNTPSPTSDSTQTATSSASATTTAGKKNDKGILLGGVIGGLALAAVVVTVLIIFKREKKAKAIKNTKGKRTEPNEGNTTTPKQANPRRSAYGKAKIFSWMGKTEDFQGHCKDLERGMSTKTSHTARTPPSNSVAETPSEYYRTTNSIPPHSPLNRISTQSTFAPYATSLTMTHAAPLFPEAKPSAHGTEPHTPQRPARPPSLTPDVLELMERVSSPESPSFHDEFRDSVAELPPSQTARGRFPTPSLEAQIFHSAAYQKTAVHTPYDDAPRPESRSLTASPEPARPERALSPDPLNIIKTSMDGNASPPTPRMSQATRTGSPDPPAPLAAGVRESVNMAPDKRESQISRTMDALEGRPPRSRVGGGRQRHPASSIYSRQLDGVTMIPPGYPQTPTAGEPGGKAM